MHLRRRHTERNIIFGNTACIGGNGYGGGVSFCKTKATLDANQIISNTATISTGPTIKGWGGGVWTGDRASLSISNDLIAGNHAKTQGSGLWFGVENEGYNPLGSRLQHVTIADNSGGIGHGVYVTNTVAFLTNTIIAGHPARHLCRVWRRSHAGSHAMVRERDKCHRRG